MCTHLCDALWNHNATMGYYMQIKHISNRLQFHIHYIYISKASIQKDDSYITHTCANVWDTGNRLGSFSANWWELAVQWHLLNSTRFKQLFCLFGALINCLVVYLNRESIFRLGSCFRAFVSHIACVLWRWRGPAKCHKIFFQTITYRIYILTPVPMEVH